MLPGTIKVPNPNNTIPPIQNKIDADRYAEVPSPMLPLNPKKLNPLMKSPTMPHAQKKTVNIILPGVKIPRMVAAGCDILQSFSKIQHGAPNATDDFQISAAFNEGRLVHRLG